MPLLCVVFRIITTTETMTFLFPRPASDELNSDNIASCDNLHSHHEETPNVLGQPTMCNNVTLVCVGIIITELVTGWRGKTKQREQEITKDNKLARKR